MSTITAPGLVRYRYTSNANGVPFNGVRVGEFVVTFRAKGLYETNSYRSKTRVFGACDELVADLNAIEPKYIPFTDELSSDVTVVEEKLWRTWRDSTRKVAQARLVALLDELHTIVGAHTGHVYSDELRLPSYALLTALRFSYKAGCSDCPCSPGFIMGGPVMIGFKPQDIWITPVSDLTEVVA